MILQLLRALSIALVVAFCIAWPTAASSDLGPVRVERLGRGLVVVPVPGEGNFLSWRLLGTEPEPESFRVLCEGEVIANVSGTNYLDASLEAANCTSLYSVQAVTGGTVGREDDAVAVLSSGGFISVPTNIPAGGTTPDGTAYTYEANDGTPADVDGDGEYEIILKWTPTNAQDNSLKGYTGPTVIDCYTLDGRQLWRINLGINIRSGAHYTQMVAFDLDSDGRAELMVKTADGTSDGNGTVIGDPNADYRNANGYVLSGPEYLTVFDGLTGKALTTTDYYPPRGTVSAWGDSYGNRVDRFLAGVAYIDGTHPSAIFARGYYTRAVVVAWNWRNGTLSKAWVHDSNTPRTGLYGEGAHWFSVGDVNDDQKHDIIYGAATLDSNGTCLYRTGLGHGDALHFGDLDPNHPGKEIYMIHENKTAPYGLDLHDAKTGEIIWGVYTGKDTGRGICMDADPAYQGVECWATVGGLRNATGGSISTKIPNSYNFAVWWDGDLLREQLDLTMIRKWIPTTSTNAMLLNSSKFGTASDNGSKATPVLSADLLGDWREEVVWRLQNNTALLLFSTDIGTAYRFPTLMHDPQYRCQVAGQNMAYNQPPHTSFYLGVGMGPVSLPSLTTD